MLPVRLRMENFGTYHEQADVDFADVGYFALVGPTGSGKSTVLDAICFALYGTVPRWGMENVVSLALAPSATEGRVGLVFEAGDRRLAAARLLARDAKGRVSTKEARLDELDPSVPQDASLDRMLRAVRRPIAEGPRDVTTEVERLTGLEYRHFTQCVLLPQGKFAEFLHATARERQNLLLQLIGAGVYEGIRGRAAVEEEAARRVAALARKQLGDLADADETAERRVTTRLEKVQALRRDSENLLGMLREHEDDIEIAGEELRAAEKDAVALDALAMPPHVPGLAEKIAATEGEIRAHSDEVARLEGEEAVIHDTLVALGERTPLVRALDADEERADLTAELRDCEERLRSAAQRVQDLAEQMESARRRLAVAEEHRDRLRDAHAAADLAGRLVQGEPCSVCGRPVTDIPEHRVPGGLQDAGAEVDRRKDVVDRHRAALDRAVVETESIRGAGQNLRARLGAIQAKIEGQPDRETVEQRLAAITAAEARRNAVREALRTAREAQTKEVRRVEELREQADRAWAYLDAARDIVVGLGAPPLDRTDLHRAWIVLLEWRDGAAAVQRETVTSLRARLAHAERTHHRARVELRDLLESGGIEVPAEIWADAVQQSVSVALARAEADLRRVRENRRRARELSEQAEASEAHARLAHEVAIRLKANNFAKWLCGEVLELLLAEASDILHELSGGQYEFVLSVKGDIEIIDYREAGLRRSMRTLSGGETFQAALSLALALSGRIAASGGPATHSLDSIFLDEGFGTLDPLALDTVATTLERLATGSGRMVGIVTHVAELAERVPVRFEVTRDDRGSHVTKVTE